jgi:leucyl/phenylalanyl-tRNA--protein transferase
MHIMLRVADLSPENLITAYCNGAFPMADPDGIVRFYHANPRGIIPLDGLVVPRSLRQKINRRTFEIRFNHDFEQIIRACRDDRAEGSWINDEIVEAYCRLHTIGIAHSVEAWHDGRLAGGLYGVSIGAAFFGESMFHRVTDASKVALVALVERLRQRDFRLLDAQAATDHLRRYGCVEVSQRQYLRQLRDAIVDERRFD